MTIYSLENSARPFCSFRCKLIDLGQWADETYKVPTPIHQNLNYDEFSIEDETDSTRLKKSDKSAETE